MRLGKGMILNKSTIVARTRDRAMGLSCSDVASRFVPELRSLGLKRVRENPFVVCARAECGKASSGVNESLGCKSKRLSDSPSNEKVGSGVLPRSRANAVRWSSS